MLLTMSLLWFYFTFTEYLVTWYGNEAAEMPVFWSKISGPLCADVLADGDLQLHHPVPDSGHQEAADDPADLLRVVLHSGRHVAGALPDHRADADRIRTCRTTTGTTGRRVTEMCIAAGTAGLFVLLYFLFAKFSPMISIWEYEEGLQVAAKHAGELPDPTFVGQTVPGDVHPGH